MLIPAGHAILGRRDRPPGPPGQVVRGLNLVGPARKGRPAQIQPLGRGPADQELHFRQQRLQVLRPLRRVAQRPEIQHALRAVAIQTFESAPVDRMAQADERAGRLRRIPIGIVSRIHRVVGQIQPQQIPAPEVRAHRRQLAVRHAPPVLPRHQHPQPPQADIHRPFDIAGLHIRLLVKAQQVRELRQHRPLPLVQPLRPHEAHLFHRARHRFHRRRHRKLRVEIRVVTQSAPVHHHPVHNGAEGINLGARRLPGCHAEVPGAGIVQGLGQHADTAIEPAIHRPRRVVRPIHAVRLEHARRRIPQRNLRLRPVGHAIG